MATPLWQAGRLYPPGSIVQPTAAPAPTFNEIPNGDFEDGDTGWTYNAAAYSIHAGGGFSGAWALEFKGSFNGFSACDMSTFQEVRPGDSITLRCQVQQGASARGNVGANVALQWFDAAFGFIAGIPGNVVNDGSGGAWHESKVTAVAPANAKYAKAAIHANRVGENKPLWVDRVEWDYVTVSPPPGLVFKATQPTSGYSGNTEPAWPSTTGVPVTDNEVTWEGFFTSRVVWEARPILLSGATEPVWPGSIGANVADGTIIWQAVSLRVEDAKCPNTKVVAIASAKIWAADKDIVRFSATGNPLDWSTKDDAGFLPVGLNQNGANDIQVLNLYRKNLSAFSATTFQQWQIDPDPQLNDLLDTMEGVGSIYQAAAQPVANDLFYLSALGVRTIGLSASANNLNAGDIGMPIDPLVQAAMREAEATNKDPLATYFPAAGQYWLTFRLPPIPVGPVTLSGGFEDGIITVPYNSGPMAVANAFTPLSWAITSGALPAGITFNPFSGVLSGTPTENGSFNITVQVTDRYGRTATRPDTVVWGYSPGLFTVDSSNMRVRSGENDTYPTVQSIPLPSSLQADSNAIVVSEDGTTMVTVLTSLAPRVYYKNALGAYVEKASAFSPAAPSTTVQAALSSDAQLLAISANSTQVWVYRRLADDTWLRIAQLTSTQVRYGLAWSPDTNYLAGCGNSPYLLVWRRTGDTFVQIFSGGGNDGNGVAWSRDSTMLAYLPRLSTPTIYGVDGTAVTLLGIGVATVTGTGDIAWSWDDAYVYTRVNAGTPRLRVWKWTGTQLTAVANPAVQPASAAYRVEASSDGRIVTVSDAAVGQKIYQPQPDGTLLFVKNLAPGATGAQEVCIVAKSTRNRRPPA